MVSSNEDPVLKSARREAIVVFITWIAALSYTVGYCTLNAYDRTPENLVFYWGIPDWILFGVVLPWVTCVVISSWFAYGFVTDAPLGEELDPEDGDVIDASEGTRHAK